MEIILIIVLILIAAVLVLQLWLIKRSSVDLSPLSGKLETLQNLQERTDRSVRDEIANFRAEIQTQSHQERAELASSLKSFGDSVQKSMAEIAGLQRSQLEGFAAQLSVLTLTNEQKMDA